MSENTPEEFVYERKDGSKTFFKEKEDYNLFTDILIGKNMDIDKQVDHWIEFTTNNLKSLGLDDDEIRFFFKRFGMAI